MSLFHKNVAVTSSGLHVEDVHNPIPQFRRIYTTKLSGGISIKIEMYDLFNWTRSCNGELTQPNGKWISFDPRAIADKILDPVLVLQVEAVANEVFALDTAFITSNPPEFTDENGVVWKRA